MISCFVTRAPSICDPFWRSTRGRAFVAVLSLAFVAAPAAAQDDPKPPPTDPPPEPPAPPPEPPPEPPAAPEEPTTPPAAPEEPTTPEEPPPPPPKPAPAPKKPPKATYPAPSGKPPAPAPSYTAPAPKSPPPKPRTTQRSNVAPTANGENEDESPSEPEAREKPEPEDDDSPNGLFGPFRLGALVGVGLPSVFSFGGAIKLTRYFGAGVNVGLIPTIRISMYGEAELSYQEYDAYGRIFPFGGMFFVGAGVGYATIKGSFKSSYDVRAYQAIAPSLPDSLAVESVASVRTLVLTPQIGLQHIFGSGFTLGIDVGLQVPLAPSQIKFDTKLPADVPAEVIDKYVKPNDQKVRDTLETIGRATVPTLNLRVGWML